ncbi:MAG TPA: ATP-binding protein [Chloroflexota bacterium]|nr:ATP-binding protein [Chloroflexota bacterium]
MSSPPISPVGIVTGHSTPQSFCFVSQEAKVPPRLEYVVIRGAREKIDDDIVNVDLLAQIAGVEADVRTLDDDVDFDEAEKLLEHVGTFPPRLCATATVLGYLHGGAVRQARLAVLPGTPVYPAPDELLRLFFSREETASITLGTLINRRGVEVKLDPNGLSRHLAIIAQTGAGKSYLAGKILEDLLGLGASIVVLDPNSDYVQLRKLREDEAVPFTHARKTEHAERIRIYRVPGIQNRRYSSELVGGSEEYTIRFSDLDADDICSVAGVPENAVRIKDAVATAVARLRARNRDFDPLTLARELAEFAGVPLTELPHVPQEATSGKANGHTIPPLPDGDDPDQTDEFLRGLSIAPESDSLPIELVAGSGGGGRKGRKSAMGEEDEMRAARNALTYVTKLIRYPVWGYKTIDLEKIVEPQQLTVIDLAGTEKVVMAYTAEWLLSNLWQRALAGELRWPVFVVLEEAHNLVPGGRESTKASRIVNTVAAEGRKFGVFLVVITQRPSKISDDTLSQCASQLIMRLTNPDDQKAVQRASEVVSQSLLENLPGLNQGEVVVLGRLTRIPAMVRVSGRRGAEGGADINLVERFEKARTQVAAERVLTPRPTTPAPPTPTKRQSLI